MWNADSLDSASATSPAVSHGPGGLPPPAAHLAGLAKELDPTALADVLVELLNLLPAQQLTRVVQHGRRRLMCDVVSLLPIEVAHQILVLLDPADLARAARVSTTWNRIISASSLWGQLYHRSHWQLNVPDLIHTRFAPRPECGGTMRELVAASVPSTPTVAAARSPPTAAAPGGGDEGGVLLTHDNLPWKYFYRQRHALERNLAADPQPVATRFAAHAEGIYCIQARENVMYSGSRDNTIRLWDIKNRESPQVLQGHTGSVLCLEQTGAHLISGSSDRTIRVWSVPPPDANGLPSGEITSVCTLAGHTEAVLNLRMDTRRNHIISCSKDNTIRMWDATSGECVDELVGHIAAVNAVQLHRDLLVSASGDRSFRVWDLRLPSDRACIAAVDGHGRGIACIAFDGRYIVTGSSDKSIRIWDLRRMQLSAPPAATGGTAPTTRSFTRDEARSAGLVRAIDGHSDLVRTVQFSAADNVLVSGSYDTTVGVWSMSSGDRLATLRTAPPPSTQTPNPAGARVFNVQWVAGRVYAALHEPALLEWDFRTGVDVRGIVRG
ncbi:hypothetical protein H9P43_001055 [Blastocladiella emersonii ATCC 22665]|nr:hypothetical protein H9P43_001055 [Blastocladiella emersonii ATCC 22665]